jgi:transposase
MAMKATALVGLDVHARQTHAAVFVPDTGELRTSKLRVPPVEVVSFLEDLGPVLAVYEAGPTGFGLARAGRERGIDVRVVAPGSIPKGSGDRVKTDRRDAIRMVRLLAAGELSFAYVPSVADERFRDLVRCIEDVRGDLMRARHRLSKLLLRHDVRFDGRGGAWTQRHRQWLAAVELGQRGAQVTLHDYVGAIDALLVRREGLEAAIAELIPDSPWAETVARLRCLRGIDTLSAVGLCAEVGDWQRFARAGRVMSFLGLVPSEHSSGQTRRQGQITKSGSGHGRRLLVEAAWHYRRPPRKGDALRRRQVGQSAHVLAISWQAQQRLHRTWRRLDGDRGKRRTIVAVAVARELAGFCWAVANAD